MKLLNEFVIKGTPETRTAQQKGVRIMGRRVVFYEKPEVTAAKNCLKYELFPYRPDQPYEGALYLRVMWLFNKKSLTKAENNSFKITYPDCDNLAKGLQDVMTDLRFWNDDNQLAKVDYTKGWSRDYPGLFIQIYQMEKEDTQSQILEWRDRT